MIETQQSLGNYRITHSFSNPIQLNYETTARLKSTLTTHGSCHENMSKEKHLL